jgi:4-alpha-glucanotransferase
MHRWAGVLLHISSLPSPFCVGDLGRSAYLFVDFLSNSGQGLWQVLPLNPTFEEFGNSPYFSTSLFAGNPLFVSPELLEEDGLVSKETLDKVKEKPTQRVDYSKAYFVKDLILEEAFRNFSEDRDFWQFEEENAYWLEDYAVFSALRKKNQSSWDRWTDLKPDPLDVKREKFKQYIFYRQWFRLKSYANERGVRIIGDLPIYPAFDSADVWKNQRLFRFDVWAGVPPDYFSPEGQLWGNPVYNWQVLREENFEWLVRRIEHSLKLYDLLRIDHFRGFVSYYVVPKGRQNAQRTLVGEGISRGVL